MKVYIVFDVENYTGCTDIKGIYSTKVKAKTKIAELYKDIRDGIAFHDKLVCEEMEVD